MDSLGLVPTQEFADTDTADNQELNCIQFAYRVLHTLGQNRFTAYPNYMLDH